jgi:hypothetical protein
MKTISTLAEVSSRELLKAGLLLLMGLLAVSKTKLVPHRSISPLGSAKAAVSSFGSRMKT